MSRILKLVVAAGVSLGAILGVVAPASAAAPTVSNVISPNGWDWDGN